MTRAYLFLVLSCLSCGSSLRTVPTGAHSSAEALVAPFPPPPAQVEEIYPLSASPDCSWLDGHFQLVGRHWEWSPGAWVVTPEGCYYAPPDLFWSNGKLFFRSPRWYPKTNKQLRCAAPKICVTNA